MRDVFFITFIGMMSIQMSTSQRKPPNYSLDAMPVTDFDCQDKIVGGYYADPQTECQMFHVCTDISGVLQDFRFLCPNNTAFDQENQICDDWYNIDCEAATLFYSDNFDLFRIDADRSNSIVNKVTPIPLGPSTSAKPKVVKAKKPLGPVNNAVTDDEDDLFLQKADTGDRRLHQDLLRGSSSSNFFENKNRGREDFDDDLSGQRKSNFVKPADEKKKTKVAVRKLLTGKRPVSPKAEAQTTPPPAPTTQFPSTTTFQNFFQKTKYNTVSRNRDSATASARFEASTTPAPTPTPTARNFYNPQKQYYSKSTPKTATASSPAPFKSRGSVNYNTYLKSQTNADFIDIPKTSAAPVYNPVYNPTYKAPSQTPTPYNSPDITQAYFNYQTPSAQPANQKLQQPNYQQPQSTNYQQPPTTYQQQPTNFQQPQQQTVQPNVNYQPFNPARTTQNAATTQNFQPSRQPAIVSPTNYQQPPSVSQFQQPSTANQFYTASTLSPTTQSPAFNYYQQYSTAAPSSAYQTSTSFAFSPSSTAAPPAFQKANYYQPKKDYSPKAQVAPVYQFNPSEDKYEENNPDEFLKTAPSSNLRPSDINALGSFNKFNTSVSASFKFSQNAVSKSSTAYNPSSTKAPAFGNSVSYNQPPARSSPKPFTLPASTTLPPKPVTSAPAARQPSPNFQPAPAAAQPNFKPAAAQPNFKPAATQPNFQPAPQPNQPNQPNQQNQQTSGNNDYDYAYYDDGAAEYDGVEHIQEEFHKTKNIKKA